jgi:hypothetical protein
LFSVFNVLELVVDSVPNFGVLLRKVVFCVPFLLVFPVWVFAVSVVAYILVVLSLIARLVAVYMCCSYIAVAVLWSILLVPLEDVWMHLRTYSVSIQVAEC